MLPLEITGTIVRASFTPSVADFIGSFTYLGCNHH